MRTEVLVVRKSRPRAWTRAVASYAVSLACLASLLTGSGCTDITVAEPTKELVDRIKVDNEDLKKADPAFRKRLVKVNEKGESSSAFYCRIAVALPQDETKLVADSGSRAAPKAGAPGSPAAPATPGSKANQAPRAGVMGPIPANKNAICRYRKAATGEMVALCYRTPVYQELLFSPAPGSPAAPEQGVTPPPAERPQMGDTVEWLCPQCQRTVHDNDGACPDCGLAFLPEEMIKPKFPTPGVPGAPEILAKDGAGTNGPTAQAKDVAPKWICSTCGNVVTEDMAFCTKCYATFVLPGNKMPERSVNPGEDGLNQGDDKYDYKDGFAIYHPNAANLQGEIVETVQAYLDPDFKKEKRPSQIVPIQFDKKDPTEIVNWCRSGDATGAFDFVLVPIIRNWRISYVQQSMGAYVGALALWVAIGEPCNGVGLPTAWIATEQYKIDLDIEFQLYHVRSGVLINGTGALVKGVKQGDYFPFSQTYAVNEWDRGYYPWSIVLLPFSGASTTFSRQEGWQFLQKALSPLAKNKIKTDLVEQTLFKTFVKDNPPNPPAVQPQVVALLIANDSVENHLERLTRPKKDLDLMMDTLKALDLHDGTASERNGNRFVTFDEKRATAQAVRFWLKTELPRLAPQDTVIVYYSGFGVTQYEPDAKNAISEADRWQKYLVLQDTEVDDLRSGNPSAGKYPALNVNEITDALNEANVSNALVLLDCSFGARAIDESIGSGRTFPLAKNNQKNAQGKTLSDLLLDHDNFQFMNWVVEMGKRKFSRGCLVFSACDQDQAAMEYDSLGSLGNGLLTYFFCDAIRPIIVREQGMPEKVSQAGDLDDDSKVSTKELREFISARVRRYANAFGVPQEVRIGGEDLPGFYFPQGGFLHNKSVLKKNAAAKGAAKGAAAAPAPAPVAPKGASDQVPPK